MKKQIKMARRKLVHKKKQIIIVRNQSENLVKAASPKVTLIQHCDSEREQKSAWLKKSQILPVLFISSCSLCAQFLIFNMRHGY